MTGYVRVDTSNNIADGNVISAADLDNEFDGIQAAFNASTGHNHDGTTGEGAPILVLGPTQDVVVGASTVTPKTTNTVDIGSSSLKFKDLFLAGNASIGGTLAVTGTTTLSGLTASTALALNSSKEVVSVTNTGTGNNVLSASPTLTGTLGAAAATFSGVVQFSAGSAAAPAITTAGDTNTGIFFPAADTIAFAEGGVEAMRINSTGFVGIGTNSPGTPLDVSSSTPTGIRYTNTDATATARVNATCGTAQGILQQYGQSHATLPSATALVSATGLITFNPSSVERMRISTAGGVSIGTTTDPGAGGLITTGNVTLGDASTDTVTVNGYMGVGGAGASSRSIAIASTALVGTSQFGIVNTPTFNSQATSAAYSYFARVQTEAASFTLPFAAAYIASTPTKGAGSTITALHGLYIDDQTQGTNNYGITSLVSSGTDKWNIYASGTAANYFAGNVGIGTSSPSASAILDAQSTTKGVRMPNMTTTQKNAIASPAAGLMVFDTTLAKLCVYTGAAWQTITST